MALTRDEAFWNAFREHAERTCKAAAILEEILRAPEEAGDRASKICELEQQADTITHDTLTMLHQTWITPLDREEIHGLMSTLDDVLDAIEAASERLDLYEIKSVREEAVGIGVALTAATRELRDAVGMLTKIGDGKAILDLCQRVSKHEGEADDLLRKGLARLFKTESNPIEVLKWKDVFETLEAATDRTEDVANILEGIVLEHA